GSRGTGGCSAPWPRARSIRRARGLHPCRARTLPAPADAPRFAPGAVSHFDRSTCLVNAVDDLRRRPEDGCVVETPLSRLLLEAHRSLGGELLEGLSERGYADVRPRHAALFMTIDRRTGTRLTELARRAHMTKQ